MIQITKSTVRRTVSAMLAASLAGTLLVGGVTAQDRGVAPEIEEQPGSTELSAAPEVSLPQVEVASEYEQIVSQLHSEYLREMAGDWGLEGTPSASSVDLSLIHSEYLREIAADW